MEKLHMYAKTKEEGKERILFDSYDKDSIISWTITALFDAAVKRCKVKVEQYYIDNKEYCRIKATYERSNSKDTYIIENWSNQWGNFIDVYDTFKNNGNIENLTAEEVQGYYKELFYELFDIILSLDYEKNTKKDIKEVMYELYDIYKKEV